MRNAVLIVAAVAVLVVGFFAVQGAEEDSGTASSADVTATQEATAPATVDAPAADTTTDAAPAPKAKPKPQIPTVVYADGAPQGGVKKLSFDKGDRVRFRVRSDVPEEIHVHGFDKYADVGPGKSATFAFDAEFDGAFEVEMHGSAQQIASLEIQP